MYDIRVVVEEIEGFCDLPAAPGDYFELKGGRLYIPPGKYICIWALQAILPLLPAKQRNIVEENDWLPGTSRICCPDPNGRVVYRIDRLPAESSAQETTPRAEGSAPAYAEPAQLRASAAHEGEAPKPNIGHMIVDPSVCSGCRSCELICSFTHEDLFNPRLSRVQISKDEPAGTDTPVICRQCGVALCVQACPRNALSRHPITRAVLVDSAVCNSCGLCADACTFHAVRMHPEARIPMLCDLCDGDPQCVRRCVTGALWYGEARNRPKKRAIGPQRRETADV